MIQLLAGDCRDVLATLPAESVQCVVTSPPYYGLRDYGTALWDGGDAACGHVSGMARQDTERETPGGRGGSFRGGEMQYRDTCGKCGARRIDRQIGLENSPEAYLATMVAVFREVRRVLRKDGTLWLNIGDSYASSPAGNKTPSGISQNTAKRLTAGLDSYNTQSRNHGAKPKDLLMMPARLALALQADGWWVRSDIIWHKPNPMPESCTDRPTSAHEHVFLLSRSARYYYDAEAVREEALQPVGEPADTSRHKGGEDATGLVKQGKRWAYLGTNQGAPSRNLRNVWTIPTSPFSEWTPSHALVPVLASEAQGHAASKSAGGRDMARITSPDCRLHAGQPDSVPRGFYDGLSDDQVSRIRDTADHRAPASHPGSSTTQHIPERSRSHPSTSDCSALEGAASATPHSTESHRTAHGSLFSERAISCAETADGKPHTPPSPCSPASIGHDTGESSSEVAGRLVSSCELETAAGTAHTPASGSSFACHCGYYRKVTTKTSHFATFPPALAERCIRAGTSERGACSQCGKPWVRITEAKFQPQAGSHAHTFREAPMDASNGWQGFPRGTTSATTTAWAPACACNADVRPCVVLDCFAGAGTTLLCADRLQRDAIGIELNPDYTRMAMQRCRDDAPLFTAFPPAEDPETERMADLFADAAE